MMRTKIIKVSIKFRKFNQMPFLMRNNYACDYNIDEQQTKKKCCRVELVLFRPAFLIIKGNVFVLRELISCSSFVPIAEHKLDKVNCNLICQVSSKKKKCFYQFIKNGECIDVLWDLKKNFCANKKIINFMNIQWLTGSN